MHPTPNARPPLFGLVFFAIFGCIGIAVLIALWSPSDAFMRPPLVFRVVGSGIALMFIAMGFGVPLTALKKARGAHTAPWIQEHPDPTSPGTAGYRCPNCGAQLGPDQEVSPSGDAKCVYCKRWWNIHRAAG